MFAAGTGMLGIEAITQKHPTRTCLPIVAA